MPKFIITDSSGKLVRRGQCAARLITAQARPGETVRPATAAEWAGLEAATAARRAAAADKALPTDTAALVIAALMHARAKGLDLGPAGDALAAAEEARQIEPERPPRAS